MLAGYAPSRARSRARSFTSVAKTWISLLLPARSSSCWSIMAMEYASSPVAHAAVQTLMGVVVLLGNELPRHLQVEGLPGQPVPEKRGHPYQEVRGELGRFLILVGKQFQVLVMTV